MTFPDRTRFPISAHQSGLFNALNRITGATERYYLGNANGTILVPPNTDDNSNSHYGKYYVRKQVGINPDGTPQLGQAVAALLSAGINIPHRTNYPVRVMVNPSSQQLTIIDIDIEAVIKAGQDPRELNLLDPTHKQFWLRQAWDSRLFAPATQASPLSSTLSIAEGMIRFGNDLYETTSIIGAGPDVAAATPSIGNERLVGVGIRADRINDPTSKFHIVSGTERTVSNSPFAFSDVKAVHDAFDDYVAPIAVVRLSDSGLIKEPAIHTDVRQFMSVQQPRGFPTVIDRHIKILNNYQQPLVGGEEITTGGLEIEPTGGLVIL